MNNQPNSKNKDFIDIASIAREWLSKWYWFVISAIVCVGLAYGYTKIRKEVFRINANLLIAQEESAGMGALNSLTSLFGSNGSVDDEVFVVSSHSVLKDVVKDLGLHKSYLVKDGFMNTNFYYQEYPVSVSTSPEIADTLRTSLMFIMNVNKNGHVKVKAEADGEVITKVEADGFPMTVDTDYGKFLFNKTPYFINDKSFKTIIFYTGYDCRAEEIAEDITMEIAAKKSNVILMSMKTTSIPYGVDLLNNIIRRYNLRGVAEKSLQGRQTAEFIDERLKLLIEDLDTVEANVEAYKLAEGVLDIGSEAYYQMGKKGNIEKELVTAETKAEILKMTRDFVRDADNAYSLIPDVTLSEEGGASKASPIDTYNGMILERMRLVSTAKPNNARLRQLEEQIDAMRENIVASITSAYDQQEVAIKELKSQVAEAEKLMSKFPVQEREFRTIRRQQSVKEALYVFLLQKREETAMLIANSIPKGTIVDEAYALNKPLGMKKKMIWLLALFIGLCMPPVLLYVKKLFRTKFETREEVEHLTQIPMLGEVCMSRSGESLVVHASGSSSTAELFRLIRTNLQFVLNGKDDKVILLTSTVSGEGKSFISINLAASLAMLGKKVLLVGMDIRAPKLAEYLHLSSKWGLTQYLSSDKVSLQDLIIKNGISENLDVILAGPVPPNPAELLASVAVDNLFAELRGMYDYIIVDSAPVGMVSDTFTLARISDATVYVCRANYTSFKDIEFINSIYAQQRLKKMGLVVNGTATRKGYGYGYGHVGEHDNDDKKRK